MRRLALIVALVAAPAFAADDPVKTGEALIQERKFAEAIALLTKAIEANPKNAEAFHQRGRAHMLGHDHKLALADFDRAVALDPKHAKSYNLRASCHMEFGRDAQAEADLAAATKIDPDDPGVLVNRAYLRARANDLPGAIRLASRALEVSPQFVDALAARASFHDKSKQYAKVVEDCTLGLKVAPNKLGFRHQRMLARIVLNDRAGADADLREILESEPENPSDRASRAMCLAQAGRAAEAVAEAEKYVELDPGSRMACFVLAKTCEIAGDFAKASRAYERLTSEFPDFAEGHYRRGSFLVYRLRRPLDGIRSYDKAIELDSRSAMFHSGRGQARRLMGQLVDAELDLSRALQLDPTLASEIWHQRGLARLEMRKFADARDDFTEALKLEPDYAFAYDARGTAKTGLGQHEAALADFTKAIELSRFAVALLNRGKCLSRLDRHAEAVADFNAALELVPTYGLVFQARGQAYQARGDHARAVQDFTAALRFGGDYTTLFHRGASYALLGEREKAERDLQAAKSHQARLIPKGRP